MTKNYQIKLVKPGIILLGFIAIATQIILLREFLTLISGNELVIGIILANWMLLTGFGAYLGKFIGNKENRAPWILTLLGILAFIPIVTVLILHNAWYSLFLPGMMAGILHVFYYSLIILFPFCVISGILFTLFAQEESVITNKNRIGDVYAWESFGSLIGGIIINFILIWISTTFQSLYIVMIVVVMVTVYLGIKNGQYLKSGLIIIAAFIFGYFFLNKEQDKKVREMAFPSQELVYMSDSPFGIFAITEQGDQLNYYENNILMASSGDIITKEESVHLAMVQHKDPKTVLVLSGLISGIIEEVSEYEIRHVDYVDINPEVFNIAKHILNTELYQTLNLIECDPVRFLRKNNNKYDVVLINFPKPSTIQLNRYYTKEFFQLLKENINEDAVVSLSMPSSANYLGDEVKKLLSIIFKTLSSEFKNVLIFPASENFLIASDNDLTYKITETIEYLNIPTEYVNSYYFDDYLLESRSKQLHQQIDHSVLVNQDFSPVFYQSQIQLWMSYFNIKYWIPALFILLFSGFFFFKAGTIYKGVFAAGFAGTSIEIILLLVFQVVFGYVYAVVGIFIMIFMGGLAYGSYYLPKFLKEIDLLRFKYLQIGISAFAFLLPVIFILIKNIEIPEVILFIIFALLIFVISVLTGAVFSIASKISQKDYGSIASRAYGLDLLGAATGALILTIYLIPLLGFIWSVLITGFFNLILVMTSKSR